MIVSFSKDCPHTSNLISIDIFNSIKFFELKCKNCEEKKDLWICLSCGEAFCGRYNNRHFYLHHQEKNDHCIGISTLDLSVWCYNCKSNNYDDPGNYIDTELTNKYVDILRSIKFNDNPNNDLEIFSNTVSPEESNKIKYENFIELLKNGKIKNGICLLGSQIYDDNNNINLYGEFKEDIIKEICQKNKIENFNKNIFKEHLEILYEYLSHFNLDIKPNLVHQFIEYLFNKNIIQILYTENIDNCESLAGIPKDKIINISGNLFESNCIKCNKQVNSEELKQNIKIGKIIQCKKCGEKIKPNIILEESEINIGLYEKNIDVNNYDVCFIIGTNLNKKVFSLISEKLSKKNTWIIFINDNKDEKIKFDFGSIFNKQIYLNMEYINKIIDAINESKIYKDINPNNPLELFISYQKEENGNIDSILLQNLRSWNSYNIQFKQYSLFQSHYLQFKNDIIFINNLISNIIKTKKCEQKLTKLESGSLGTMLGMAIADSMGHRFEFEPLRYNEITLEDMGEGPGGAFSLLPGQWTDDTSMGLCLADSLIAKNGKYDAHDLMHRFLCWWFYGYNNAFKNDNTRSRSVGLGGQINQSFMEYIKYPIDKTMAGDKNSSGIGSIMRNAAVPILFHDNIEKGMKIAELQSLVTHQGIEAAECCRLLTYIVINILNRKDGQKLNEIIDNMEGFKTEVNSVKCLALSKEESDDPDRNWNWKKKDFQYSPTRSNNQPGYIGSYAMDGMAMALHVVYYTSSFREAIIKVVNLCGDADSVGAVVGQIAGAYYGIESIPPEWIETVSKWDNFEIPLRGYILQKLLKNK